MRGKGGGAYRQKPVCAFMCPGGKEASRDSCEGGGSGVAVKSERDVVLAAVGTVTSVLQH